MSVALARLSSFITPKRRVLLEVILLSVLVLAGFLLRINVFDVTGESYFHVDVARDHLIATHMVMYGEFPTVGPDGYLGPLGNSPAYYYLIAGLLLIHNALLFPGLINVFLQTIAIVMVYFIARSLFGRVTALFAAALFAFSDGIVAQAMQMWQPHLMQFFLLGSTLLFIEGTRKKRLLFLSLSAVLFTGACIIHNSVFAIAPLYAVVLAYVFYIQRRTLVEWSVIGGVCAIILSGAYASVVYTQLITTEVSNVPYIAESATASIATLLSQFIERSLYLFTYLFEGSLTEITVYTYVLAVFFFVGSGVYLFFQKDRQKKIIYSILFASIVLLVCVVGVLSLSSGGFPIRYFTPIYVPFLILFAELFASLYRTRVWVAIGTVILLAVVVYISSEYVRSRFEAFPDRIAQEGIRAVYPPYAFPEDVYVLAQYIKEQGYGSDIDLRTIEREYEEIYRNELVWVGLESLFGTQLVKLDPSQFRGYAPVGSKEHMFVRCLNTEEEKCRRIFMEQYGYAYQIHAMVYETSLVRYLYARHIRANNSTRLE